MTFYSKPHVRPAVTFSFHHTQVGMQVRVKDDQGIWHDFELAPYKGESLDTAREELAYVSMWRSIGYAVDVRQHYH